MNRYTSSKKIELMHAFSRLKKPDSEKFMKEHHLSFAELNEWVKLFKKHGVKGLQAGAAAKGKRL